MDPCGICIKNKNEIIYENSNWIITHGPFEAQILGYFYMAPKRHIENWHEFTEAELKEIGPLIKKVEEVLKEEIDLERLYTITISEAMRHIHFHLIPREVNSDIRGISLIEQATLQKSANKKDITEYDFNDWLEKLKVKFSQG